MADRRLQVASLLAASEECRVAEELQAVGSNTKSNIVVGLIENKERRGDFAIVITEPWGQSSLRFIAAIPILTDMVVKINGDLSFDLMFKSRGNIFAFCATTTAAMWSFVTAITKAYQIACTNNLTPESGSSHKWLSSYESKYHLADLNISSPDLDRLFVSIFSVDREARLASASSSSSSSAGPSERLPSESKEISSASVIHDIRESYIRRELRKRAAEYTDVNRLSVFCGSWNVNNKKPGESMAEWLQVSKRPDIYCIGMQEIDLTAGALIAQETEKGPMWTEGCQSELGSEYVLVSSKQLVGVFICCFVRRDHVRAVQDIRVASEGVGIMGVMGNKGGCGVRFKFYDTTFCFISAHLAAHMKNVDRRNADFHDVLNNMDFGPGSSPLGRCPSEHDFVFWVGDLNYRIDRPDAEVKRKIQEADWPYLFDHDQLNIQRKLGKTPPDFAEGKIAFAPTYRYDTGTNNYDTSEKQRTPAWTDRILWRGEGVEQLSYNRVDLLTSDHKPVYAGFTVPVRVIVEARFREVEKDIIKNLDKLDNQMRPECKLDKREVDFGTVQFGQVLKQVIYLENIGQSTAQYSFAPKPGEKSICRPWLVVDPYEGILFPGQRGEITLTLSVNPENGTASALNSGNDSLEDVLIIKLVNGGDIYCVTKGNYVRSSFGMSLEDLVQSPDPISSFPTPRTRSEREELQRRLTANSHKKLMVPKEIWRMVDYIYKTNLAEEDLFLQSGVEAEMHRIQERLDSGESFEYITINIHSMADTLLRFLRALADSVVPVSMYTSAIRFSNNAVASRNLVAQLPASHYNTFHYISSFLREVLAFSETNMLSAETLASVFGACMLRPPEGHRSNDQKQKADFMMHFISHSYEYDEPSK